MGYATFVNPGTTTNSGLTLNAVYPYDYLVNNCSTKVRDALNRALGGALERQLARRSAPHTYRFDAVRLISLDPRELRCTACRLLAKHRRSA